MAEDLAELGLEAVEPITNHDKVDHSIPFHVVFPLTHQFSGLAKGQEQGQEWLQQPPNSRGSSVQREPQFKDSISTPGWKSLRV
jgi:hypothetical protein